MRILTNPRITTVALPLERVLTEATRLREHPGVATLVPGARHWVVFERLCRTIDARGIS